MCKGTLGGDGCAVEISCCHRHKDETAGGRNLAELCATAASAANTKHTEMIVPGRKQGTVDSGCQSKVKSARHRCDGPTQQDRLQLDSHFLPQLPISTVAPHK
eukprot:CAMPEP_0204443592 /NCGR_PEP_ID=MMETSP0470-20130426/89449_1 /ASSEMBLY_ACC=CAM_ASM_000385 /TAXON_ID=2969 /ORGANISM="Oxyrrhis marina" /LENGTH=102 /DNA_ID=CAMNT_0051442895 /DNA_START=550 /DNA_END=859 /DNA_ORIENTATION=+